MSDPTKWKSKLLSSSLPLEFQVAKLLASREFTVRADYPYDRADSGVRKEFSVDVHASTFTSTAPADADATPPLDLLVECKYRHPNVTWLFLPDPNDVDFSPHGYGMGLRGVDTFSKWFIQGTLDRPERSLAWCYKGVEVEIASGSVHDSEIRHGVLQLQYALPSLLIGKIRDAALAPPSENLPFFYAPILVTTAELIVAFKNLSLESLARTRNLRELGRKAQALMLYAETGPDFESHSSSRFETLTELVQRPSVTDATNHRKSMGVYEHYLPPAQARLLRAGLGTIGVERQFSHFFICHTSYFGKLVTSILRTANAAAQRLKLTPQYGRKQKVPAAG